MVYQAYLTIRLDGPIEVCLPVTGGGDPIGPLEAKDLPATRVAVAALHGLKCSFPAVLQGYDAVYD